MDIQVPLPTKFFDLDNEEFKILSQIDLEMLKHKSLSELIRVIDQLTCEIDQHNKNSTSNTNVKYMSLLNRNKKLKIDLDITMKELTSFKELPRESKRYKFLKKVWKKIISSYRAN
jgi:hypothetical protein